MTMTLCRRDQLKQQYRATQLAQVAERAASESKKRFVSYIFHEVRVPLNTALLAFQNLDGEKMFDEVPPDQREMVTGLNSSLGTMKNVLNDVLDFSRMEAGKLTWTNKPFNINATFRAMLMAFRGVAAARKINLLTDFDPAIDAYSPLLLGDEMRLSQVISNLTSNACKFTQNGTVTFVTRLLYPSSTTDSRDSESRESSVQKSWEDIELHGLPDSRRGSEIPELPEYRRDIAIVRIEIQDSGVGIAVQDLVDNRLFSPYVQTDEGRRQGGKGSGLGLALVRKIVKLSGGRLGVTSVLGKGSTFWLEMPFRKPSQAVLDEHAMSTSLSAPDISFDAEPAPTASPAVNTEDATSSTTSPTVLQTPDIESAMLCVPPPASPAEERSTPLGTPFCLQVLVVDDDPLTRKLLQRLLERLGCSVTLATNGQEALDILLGVDGQAPRVFDMISLDNSMPILGAAPSFFFRRTDILI
jgi:signal transduction histidine kinase